MSKRQKKTPKSGISQGTAGNIGRETGLGSFRPVSPSTAPGGSGGSYRKSKHLNSELLKYDYPKDKGPGDIFSSLSSATQQKLRENNVEVTTLVEGFRVSPSERKLIDCFCKLLEVTSQTKDEEAPGFYLGNSHTGETVAYYQGETTGSPAPGLSLSLYEIAKEYKASGPPSGKDESNVLEIIEGLANKRFLINHTEKYWEGKKGKSASRERQVEGYTQILWTAKVTDTERDPEGNVLSSRQEVKVILSPIFRAQISSYFILVPNDINRRTQIAYGSHNISGATLKLRDYFLEELSNKREEVKISLEKLLWRLGDDMMKQGRKKLVREHTQKAIDTMVALGLLMSWELKPSDATGELIYHFLLNREFHKEAATSGGASPS